MESSSSVGTRTRSRRRMSYETMTDTENEYDDSLIYLGEQSQYSESSEGEQSEDRESSEDESEEIHRRISEVEFRNKDTHYVPEVKRISKTLCRNKKTPNLSDILHAKKYKFERLSEAQFRNKKRRNLLEESAVVKKSKAKSREDKSQAKEYVFERISEAQFRNKKRHNLSEESAASKPKSRDDDQSQVKDKEFVFERISKTEFRNKKTHYRNNKFETTSVRKPVFRNRHIKKEDQVKTEAEISKRHHRSAQKCGGEHQNERNESEDSDEIKIIESSSSARACIRKGKQSAYIDAKTDSIGTSRKMLKNQYRSNNRKSDHHMQLEDDNRSRGSEFRTDHLGIARRTRLRPGVAAEKPLKLVIEITSDSSPSNGGWSDSMTSKYDDDDDDDDSLYESKEVSSSSAESDEEDYVPEEKSEEDHSRSGTMKHLMEFSDSNTDNQENVHQQEVISKKHHLPRSRVSLDASSKVKETEVRDIQENNERAKHVQESVTKRVKGKRNDEREFHSEDHHPKRLKKVVSSMSNETGKRMEKQTEKSANLREEEEKTKGCIDEAIRKGKKKVDVEEDSGIMHQNSTSSTPIKEVNAELEETEQPITKRHGGVHIRPDDQFCKNLLDSVLGENDEDKNREEANQSFGRLPLKFRFEDEVQNPVQKSEYEIMTDNLFDELNFCLTLEGETGPSEVDKDNNNVEDCAADDDETDQSAMCRKGKHYLIQDDEQGLICLYCLHVEIAAKDILPSWAEKTYRRVERPRISSNTEQPVQKDGLIFLPGEQESSSTYNFNHGGNGTTIWDDVKPNVQRTMFEHQREGFEFLWRNIAGTTQLSEIAMSDSTSQGGGCIISHAPGTGKTRLTIVFIETYLRRFPNCRPLIIAPASMLLTWEEEFKRWEVEFPFHNLNSPEIADRELKMALQHIPREKNQKKHAIRTIKIYSWNKGKSILGMSYDLFVRLVGDKNKGNNVAEKELNHDFMKTILLEKPGLVVLDEGHIPRNQGSNNWQAISKLKTEKRIILSGTPFQNNFEELFNVLQVVRPSIMKEERFKEIFASKRQFYEKRRRQSKQNDNIVVEENVDNGIKELKMAMAPFVHVHKGTILLENLPGLMDCVVLLKPLPLQKSLIEKIERSQNIFTVDSKVAHISAHPYLFKKCEQLTEKEKSGVDESALEESRLNPNEGVKTRFIMELVRISLSRKEKVLIFSQYLEPLSFMKEHLEKSFNWAEAKQILMIRGGVEQKHRQNFISSFNDPNSEAKVLLASTRCCSEGIHLVGASRVVLLDVVWNHAVERQAICRAYRLGQKKVVYTYHLMAMGTREQNKFQQQAKKAHLSELVFTSSSNEKCKAKNLDAGIIDGVLEHMVADEKLKDLFDKVIYQPKEKNLIESFGLED